MEYLGGGTLAERGRSGSISHADSVAWLTQAADALDEAHRHGIVHRDVKPANLLFDDRGTLKVVDFGIARVVDETTSGMTIAGTVLGTAGYLSPEQARGEPTTAASDIYGLGVVAYELLTGGRPFAGGSATEEAAAHLHQPVPPASERGVGLSHEVDRVLERALAKDPGERYGTATAFVKELRSALDGTGHTKIQPAAAIVPPTAATRDEPRREPARAARSRGSRRPWLPLAIGILLAVGALAGFALATTVGDRDDAAPKKQRTTPAAAPAEPTTNEITVTETLPGTTVQETVTVATPPPAANNGGGNANASGASGAGSLSMAAARSLTDEATDALRGGDYERAYALAAEALDRRLRGTGDIYEAYASYDAGAALARLGQCDERARAARPIRGDPGPPYGDRPGARSLLLSRT